MGGYTDENLPERVNVMKVVSYDVEQIVSDLRDMNGDVPNYVPTYGEVMKEIERCAEEDFSCEWGHTASVRDLIFQDQDGSDI